MVGGGGGGGGGGKVLVTRIATIIHVGLAVAVVVGVVTGRRRRGAETREQAEESDE